MPATPYLLQFDQIGDPNTGYICSTQLAAKVPFEIKRVFWLQGIPQNTVRGQHANKQTEEVLVAINGGIEVKAETASGLQNFKLTTPDQGLYIPAICWTELKFQENTIGLCLASTDFDEADYIRDYSVYKQLISNL